MATQKTKVTAPRPTVTAKPTARENATATPEEKEALPFQKMNYILLLVGIAIIGLGFLLMRGPFVDSKTFSVPLHVAPILVVAGFIEVIFAIMYVPKKQEA